MIDFIKAIVNRHGGRIAGSPEERAAQKDVQDILAQFCDKVEWHDFEAKLKSKFQSLKLFCFTYLLALIVFYFNPLFGLILAGINGLIFLFYFVRYGKILNFLYKSYSSCNVVGTIEPLEEATSTIMVAGHIDSVYEFQWWYKLKNLGGYLTTLSGLLLTIQGLLLVLDYFVVRSGHPSVIWYICCALSPVLITMYAMHGKVKVDGALDNLTGVAMAIEMGKVFRGDNKLKHTRLRCMSFGSEETGLKGALAYVKDHKQELIDQNTTLINVDTITRKRNLTIVKGEINPGVFYPKDLVEKMESAFKNRDVDYKKINLPIGATDAAAFAFDKIPAVSIVGLETSRFDPTYHTREDKLENLDTEGINALRDILIDFIEEWDLNNVE